MLRRRAARSTRSTWRVPRRAVCSDTSPSGPWAIRRSTGWRARSVSWRRRCSFGRRHPASVSAGSRPSWPRSVWSRCSVCGVSCSRRRGRGPSSRQADLAEGMTRDIARWDPLARVDVMRFGSRGDSIHYAFLIDPSYPTESRPPALAMELDMGALTPIIGMSSPSDLAVLDASVLGAPYELAARSNVLVIGPGGGIDVMTALRHGARSVTAVEVNRAVVALMRGPYAEYSGEVYADTRVHLVEDEARSFVRRSADRYDLVVMTVVDSFAALSSGAYALTESYLYTQEAMADYLAHLAPGGSLSVGRLYRDPPVEIVRTFKIAVAGLTALGKSNPETHIAVLRYGNFGLLLIGDRAFGAADVERLRGFASRHGFELAYDPLHPGEL